MAFKWELQTIKMVSIFYDGLYMICGLIAIILGAKVIGSLNNPQVSPQSTVYALAVALIIFGFIIFLVAAIGSFSVIRDSEKGLIVFGIALGALIILKIIVAIIVLAFINDAVAVSKNEIAKTFNQGEAGRDEIDNIQRSYECCGLTGTNFFVDSEGYLPKTCCSDEGNDCHVNRSYKIGCSEKVASVIEGMGTTIGLVLFGIAFFEIAGLILSVCLKNSWKNEIRREEFSSA
ncbi:CD63 antigen-like [Culicoides brevitarsis]|uniref:CD63 antigen-like n=1 Tax=Culicoides brevitarsis TaxID=469753 RepID=UPI00307C77F8